MHEHVLVVEDDEDISMIIRFRLESEGFLVTCYESAEEVPWLGADLPDAILLDIVLPGASGLDLVARFRERYSCPIIFMSCLDDKQTIIRAFEMGGDDYLTKPFDADVLIARIRANLRRAGTLSHGIQMLDRYDYPGFALDTRGHRVAIGNRTAQLSKLEFQIMLLLVQHPYRFFSAAEIYRSVWGKDSYGDVSTVYVHLCNIRKKIAPGQSDSPYLHHERGGGYAFWPPQD